MYLTLKALSLHQWYLHKGEGRREKGEVGEGGCAGEYKCKHILPNLTTCLPAYLSRYLPEYIRMGCLELPT